MRFPPPFPAPVILKRFLNSLRPSLKQGISDGGVGAAGRPRPRLN